MPKYDVNSKIPSSKFKFINGDNIHDEKFETKPVGYLQDCLRRFAKNKASVVAAVIIGLIVLFAIVEPIADPINYVQDEKAYNADIKKFQNVLPRINSFAGSGFWDGTQEMTMTETKYNMLKNTDSNYDIITEVISKKTIEIKNVETRTQYVVSYDSYAGIACQTISSLTMDEIQNIESYEKEHDIYRIDRKSVLKPVIDYEGWIQEFCDANGLDATDNTQGSAIGNLRSFYKSSEWGNIYFKLQPVKVGGKFSNNQVEAVLDENGNVQPIYKKDGQGNLVYYTDNGNGTYNIRVDFVDYFTYKYGFAPSYAFGANDQGQSLIYRLAKGIRFSILLGVGVSLINFVIGLLWGVVSGYYGGTVDLVMERVTDIISSIPTIIIMTIAAIQFTNNEELTAAVGPGGTLILSFLLAFVYNGWVGVAGTTRMQFYRFKGQEYVLASRSLGAKDSRLIFKHILPNAIGTLVTSCVLMIPGIIFSESSLSYLGIVNFTTSGLCSVGALLSEGQQYLKDFPHMVFFPAVVISLLMICFNLFGNGLRDAFNTSLRGSED